SSRLLFFTATTATPVTYTLSLHDALPISGAGSQSPLLGQGSYSADQGHLRPHQPGNRCHQSLPGRGSAHHGILPQGAVSQADAADRKSTRLNSSHVKISYAVFCLKKKKNK